MRSLIHWHCVLICSSFCFLSSLLITWAQKTIQQALWDIPDGSQPGFSDTFSQGNTIPLSWNALVTTAYVDTTKNLVDLWATAYDTSSNPFAQRITDSINLTSAGHFSWTIAIPASSISADAKYVLRFKATNATYNPNNGELSSPGILILTGAGPSSSSPSSAASTSLLSSSTSSTSSAIASSTSMPSSQTSTPVTSAGLSTGAKVGIILSIIIVVLVLVAMFYMFVVRKKKSTVPPSTLVVMPVEDKNVNVPPTHLQELHGTTSIPTSYRQDRVAELG